MEYVNSELLTIVRLKRSWIWEHGYDLREVQSRDTYWKCKISDNKNKASATNNPERHLFKEHRIRNLKRRKHSESAFNDDENVTFSSGTATPISDWPPRRDILQQLKDRAIASAKFAISCLPRSLTDLFKEYLILWIVSYQITISAVENKTFRDLVNLLYSDLAEALPASGNTVRKWIIDYFEIKKVALILSRFVLYCGISLKRKAEFEALVPPRDVEDNFYIKLFGGQGCWQGFNK